MLTVCVASTSGIKIGAVRDALLRLGLRETQDFRLRGCDASSGVNAQPIGPAETWRGAQNRLIDLKRQYPEGNLFISMENGIIPLGQPIDLAVLILEDKDGEQWEGTSAGIAFPREAYMQADEIGFLTHTVGKEVARMTGGSHDDPHTTLTNPHVSRREILADAVYLLLARCGKFAG